ncbi:MAG TPA: hypothetical protein VJ579_04905 [Candidatus Paceibacterota bacterium]|nr:hypothetical protein [Candidatus Paceibacterota bacterium]
MEDTKNGIRSAIRLFMDNDWVELMNVKIYEPTLSHRIALYLESNFGQEFNIDCEYSKSLAGPKMNDDGTVVRPDIIIHRRGSNERNLAIFEIKKCSPSSILGVADINKIRSYRNLNYQIGIFVGVLKRCVHVVWVYRDGRIVEEVIS